jgi:hypothetical protein
MAWGSRREVVMFNRDVVVTVHVDFPALADLVAYLKARDDQQKQIDVSAAQVEELTKALHQSSMALKGSVEHSA